MDYTHAQSDDQPLLDKDGVRDTRDYQSSPPLAPARRRKSSTLRRISPHTVAQQATRRKYATAAFFLGTSLVAFVIQTETAVYIQRELGWAKAYCMLYLTHGSWTLLWPTQLLVLRFMQRGTPWKVFWNRHVQLLRSTAQMVETQSLNPPRSQRSPVSYMVRKTVFITCALTVAGGSWYLAVDLTTPSDLTAIYNCSAFFAYAFSVPLLGEKLRLDKSLAVLVAIVGVLIVAYGDAQEPKHGGKSGGAVGGGAAGEEDTAEPANRLIGNVTIGIGSVLYGFYEVLYKKLACPPEGVSSERSVIFANTFGSLIGLFTLTVLWIPLPILHYTGWEEFALPTGTAAWVMLISVLANATFSGSFLVLMSLTSPVLSSVAALLTIFLVAIVDRMFFGSELSSAALGGGLLIIAAFILLSYSTYKEMTEERQHKEMDMEADMLSISDKEDD